MIREIHTFNLRLVPKSNNDADMPIRITIYCSSTSKMNDVLSRELRLAGIVSDLSLWDIQILSHDSFRV